MIDTKVVDIHSHILPNIDDGSKNFDITKQMIQLSYQEGCRHLFLTPHASCLSERTEVVEKMDVIRKWITDEGIELKIYTGSEIYVDPEDDEDIEAILGKLKSGIYPTLNGTKYVLIEFYFGGFELDEVVPAIKELIAAGYIPVIAHAEKYGVSFEDLCYIRSLGCKFQMNVCDLYRDIENDITQMTHILLKEKMFDFIGTDAHDMDRRTPALKEYVDFLYKNYDKDYVEGILFRNAIDCFGLG